MKASICLKAWLSLSLGVLLPLLAQAEATATTAASKPAVTTSTSAPASAPVKAVVEDGMARGITRCANDLTLSFPVTGRVAVVKVKEGSEVKRGEVLMHLDQAAEALDVERRRMQWQSKAELAAAQARRETAKLQVEAARHIFSDNRGISQEELQNRELAYSLAASEYERLANAKEMERLDYLTAKENLERRSLRAPSISIVTKLVKQLGEGVQANEPAIRLCDMSKIVFVANIPTAALNDLSAKDTVELLVGHDNQPVSGKVTFVSPVVDAASGLREVKVDLVNPPKSISPGMPARLNLNKIRKTR